VGSRAPRHRIPNSKEASMAKAYAPQVAMRASIGAVQIMAPGATRPPGLTEDPGGKGSSGANERMARHVNGR
jgi:alkylation response protein AidB-like acyl-CoA dehydrogenase